MVRVRSGGAARPSAARRGIWPRQARVVAGVLGAMAILVGRGVVIVVVSPLSQTSLVALFCCLSLRLGLHLLSYISLPLYTRQVSSRPPTLIAQGLFSQQTRSTPAKPAHLPSTAKSWERDRRVHPTASVSSKQPPLITQVSQLCYVVLFPL